MERNKYQEKRKIKRGKGKERGKEGKRNTFKENRSKYRGERGKFKEGGRGNEE